MDPALIREREAFLKRAKAQPVVEKKRHKNRDENDDRAAKRGKSSRPSVPKPTAEFDYKTMSGSSQFKFSILAKIVKYMKERHQKGDTHALLLEEILDETRQTDIGSRQKHWLGSEALINNTKIEVIGGEMFAYKPKYNMRDRKGLLKLLKNHDLQGLGGILMDDVEESVPNCDKVIKQLGDNILFVTRPADKKKVLFYNDKDCAFEMDEEFQKLWRSVTVEGLDENKIDEYLEKQGITALQDIGPRKVAIPKRKNTGKRRSKAVQKQNEHLDGILEDYSQIANKT